MIHQLTIPGLAHTYILRFPADKLPDARFRLWLWMDQEKIGLYEFNEAAQQLKEIEERHMIDMDVFRRVWVSRGFFPVVKAFANGWEVSLWHNLPAHELHRQPTGRAETLADAMAAAEADLSDMLERKKAKAG